MNTFEEYVIARGYLDPRRDISKEILNDETKLSAAAGIWRNSREVIELVLKARIFSIWDEMSREAHPFEIPILRQAIVEIALIGEDFERYATEFERRKEDDPTLNGQSKQSGEGSPPPPVEQPDNAEDNGKEPSTM